MSRRLQAVVLMGALAFAVACTNKKVNNPLANVSSKQPDKVLFDRAMNAMKHNQFDVARMTLQTLINTYPDSEFIARAKLGVADSWYAEGTSTGMAQAEIEYNDFKTFFPNMPEAAEAQLKIANIHYQQMQKPDRDYTHAFRAEQEYRSLILQWPDSKLVPQAKQRLREVQEIMAEREFQVGKFYATRQSFAAGIARLRSVVERYPLYSKADEALYLLGQTYEAEITAMNAMAAKSGKNDQIKAGIEDSTKNAAAAYSKILTRYPMMDRANDAKARLIALHQPVPRPTKAAVAQNKAEEDSRRDTGTMTKLLRNFNRHPDVAQATKVGDPTLVDTEPVSATDVVKESTQAMIRHSAGSEKNTVSVETVKQGAPPPNQPVPRSDDATATPVTPADPAAASANAQPDPNELKPNVPADPNELKPNVPDNESATVPPPQQVNEIQPGAPGQNATQPGTNGKVASSSPDQQEDESYSSSKKKKKKGLKKIIPF